MKEIQTYPAEAESVCLYAEGNSTTYASDTAEFAVVLQAWNAMTAQAIQMPAFGVSIDRLTREELRHGYWAEFVFRRRTSARECRLNGFCSKSNRITGASISFAATAENMREDAITSTCGKGT